MKSLEVICRTAGDTQNTQHILSSDGHAVTWTTRQRKTDGEKTQTNEEMRSDINTQPQVNTHTHKATAQTQTAPSNPRHLQKTFERGADE